VLKHWAGKKIGDKGLGDEVVVKMVVEKLMGTAGGGGGGGGEGVSCADVAEVAWREGRIEVATRVRHLSFFPSTPFAVVLFCLVS